MNRMVKIPLYVCCVLGLFCMNVYAASGYVCLHLWNSGEYQKAVSTCENACSKNDSRGCLGLGSLYLKGEGVKQDYSKAKTYFEKACNLSDYGCSGLGDLYSRDEETKCQIIARPKTTTKEPANTKMVQAVTVWVHYTTKVMV